jgi:perosamine synthetase
MATANAVILSDNTPVFTDIDDSTLCMSYDTIMDRMTSDVSAIIIVHMGGLVTQDIYKIRKFCDRYGLHLIEDAAHAHGAQIYNEYRDEIRCAGSLGDVGCFSFYPTKLMTTGEGGMITTDNDTVVKMARMLRNHGGDGTTGLFSASNDRMTEISAILGLSQLKRLDEFVKKRNHIAKMYRKLLENITEIDLLPEYEKTKNSYWNFYFILNNIDREKFINKMLQFGIQLGDAYNPPCHRQPVFERYVDGYDFKVADTILKNHVSLPMYTELTDDDVVFIVDKVKEVVNDYKK